MVHSRSLEALALRQYKREKRSVRARILRMLKEAWRTKGKGEECHIKDPASNELALKYEIVELDLPRGTVLRLGDYKLDVEGVIERKYREACAIMGLDRLSRVEAISATVSTLTTDIYAMLIPIGNTRAL